ncbi:MAG: hypothetical protein U0X73_06940 [Thermoanaerobaculia bacterium]
MDPRERQASIDRAVEFLAAAQESDGAFAVLARRRGALDLEAADPSPFSTALVARGLESVPSPAARAILERALDSLQRAQSTGGVWKHWPPGHPRAASLPPDADDTACAIDLLARRRGLALAPRAALLAAGRDASGRFHTWILPRLSAAGRPLAALRLLRWRTYAARRHPFWDATEARPDDVDAGVNANVLLALGDRPATAPAARWLADRIARGDEASADKWHRHPWAVRFFVARAMERHAGLAAAAGPALGRRIAGEAPSLVAAGDALALALATAAARHAPVERELAGTLAEALAARQEGDGGFPRAELYFGGPRESVGWGSRALTTGIALVGLGAPGVTE